MSLLREAERYLANQSIHAALNAFITALAPSSGAWKNRVNDADRRQEQGLLQSKVDGRLISIKDNICTRDMPTTCASGILDRFSSPFNATVVELLENAGAVIAGKTNLDEFGMGSHSVHSRFGPVKSLRNDTNTESLSAGGSSGGSAVAVATDQCYAALGTDTGGSVRLPAAYTGIVGFKPSYGLISRWGVVAYANSLDTVGIMGKKTSSVRDIFGVVNRHDPRDPTNLSPFSRSRVLSHLGSPSISLRSTSPLTIGVPIEYNISELAPSVLRAWSRALQYMQQQGHIIRPVSLPATKLALSAYYVLAPAEASSNLAKYDGVRYGTRFEGPSGGGGRPEDSLYANTRGEGLGAETMRRILLGTFSLSADAMDNYFIQAQRVRRLVQRDFDAVFKAPQPLAQRAGGPLNQGGVDVILCPTVPSPPPRVSDLMASNAVSAPLEAYMNDVFTVPASLAGLPAISVPVTVRNDQLGLGNVDLTGIQVIGQYGDDDIVLKVGESLEGRAF